MQTSPSVIISCAGIGSRLGLGTTKALVDFGGKPLIHWQLECLRDVADIRIAVGFQANKVIEEVRKIRPDAIFVFNHDYFNTKTGSSYYLGARHGEKYALEIDGDLIIHPEDMRQLLTEKGEWAAYADKMSDDGIYLDLNKRGEVTGFSREHGQYEWTGPCCLKKRHIANIGGHVYEQLERRLPLRGIKVRALDIDTYEDYERAKNVLHAWHLLD